MYSERWERALALNAEILRYTQERGADALEVARKRFNDYGPLLCLGVSTRRVRCCGTAAPSSRRSGTSPNLGKVYGALADLEDKAGDRAAAVRFEQTALGYTYQAGEPEDCAISHHNLAIYLQRQGADPALVLAHRLAAAVIWLQTQSGQLPVALRHLANAALPPAPPSFAEVVARWRPSRACALPPSSNASPAACRTGMPRLRQCGSW